MALRGSLVVLLNAVAVCVVSQCPRNEDFPACMCLGSKNDIATLRCHGKNTGKTIEDYRKMPQENDVALEKTKIDITFHSFNKESRLPSNIFEGLRITSLTFRACNVSRWADEEGSPAFVGLEDTLEKLVFIDNTIRKTEKHNIKDYQNDKALMSLGHLRKLLEVDFSLNYMFNFGNDWFGKGTNSVEVLKLIFCHLYFIGDQAFAGLVNLKKIFLTRNEVSVVRRSMFPDPAEHLQEIYLWDNKIKSLPEDMFTNMPALTLVDVSRNPMHRLPENVWSPIWSRLEHLSFKYNKLYCDDDIRWMFEVRHPKNLFATCQKPDDMEGVDLMTLIKQKQSE